MLDEYFVVATLLISLKYGDHANHPARPAASSFSRPAATLTGCLSSLSVCASFAGVAPCSMKQSTAAASKAKGVTVPCLAFGVKSCGPHHWHICGRLYRTSMRRMQKLRAAASQHPRCRHCATAVRKSEQATTFCGDCGDCKSQQILCDCCYNFAHKSAKKKATPPFRSRSTSSRVLGPPVLGSLPHPCAGSTQTQL